MAATRRRKRRGLSRKAGSRLGLTLALGAALLLFILVMPKSVTPRALNVSANGIVSTHVGLYLSEVMTDNVSAFPDEKGKFGDWIEIENTLDEPMSLKGVGLSDRSDRITFLFPDVTLAAHGRVVVFADDRNADTPGQAFHAKFKLSSLGETVYLFDASGVCIDSVKVPTLNGDESYYRTQDGVWEKGADYSPDFENGSEGHAAYMAHYAVAPGSLYINEVAPSPRSGFRDEDGELSDWVELYNAGNTDISLGHLALSDDPKKPMKWAFPKDAVIPAGGYYIVFCSGKNKVEEGTRYPHTSFSVNNEEETLVLSTLAGELVDRVTVTGVEKDMSYGRDPDSLGWRMYTLPTPGAPNNQTGANRADEYLRAVNPSQVFISEVMSSANTISPINGLPPSDYVELYNASAQTWDLSGWGLSDNVNWPRKWTFPQGASIFPGEYKVVLLDKSETPGSNAGQLHASFALSRLGGEMMTLSDATGRVLDRMYIPEIPTDISYGRTLGSGGFFYYDAPTPGAANASGFSGYAQKPVFVTPSGLYKGTLTVEIIVPDHATVRYTTDGSIPTLENSQVYSGPIEITMTTVFRARSFQPGLQISDPVTCSYIMNTYHALDVVSLVCDPKELWDRETGLLSDAPDLNLCTEVDKSRLPFKTPVYRNYGKIARPGYVELFSAETSKALLSQGIKMDLMGDFSLDMPQKSFKLRAQAAYGEKYFDEALFDDRDYTFYKSFALRNSGNDCVFTRVIDGVQTRLVDKYLDTDLLTLAWKPVAVYLNGTYWGHYNLRERKDRFSIAQYEGLDIEDTDTLSRITILRAGWSTVQGSNKEYREMLKTIADLSPNTKEADLQYLYDHIDVNNYLDWFAVKMFFGDSDPGNIMFYKLPGEGAKWKCLLFDLDYGLYNSEFNSPWSYMKKAGMGEQKINNTIFRKLLESDEIRDQFFTKFGIIFQTLTTDVMIRELDECTAIIKPELPRHYARWAEYKEPTINSDSPITAEGYMRYWQTRVDRTKNTMRKRPHFLWKFIQEEWKLTDAEMIRYFGRQPENLGK